jgi:hypothetical protein
LRKTFDTTDESSNDLPFWGPTAIRMDAKRDNRHAIQEI